MKRKKVPNVLEKSAEEIEYYCAWKKNVEKNSVANAIQRAKFCECECALK